VEPSPVAAYIEC